MAVILDQIGEQSGSDFADMKAVKDLVDFQYENFTVGAFSLQFKIFLLFYILPNIILVFTRDKQIV